MSNNEYDSDASLSTEEINDISHEDVVETEEVIEEKKETPIIKRTRKKKAPISDEKKLMEIEAKEELKALKAQKKKDERLTKKQQKEATKIADKVILHQKEKVIYMVQRDDGNFLELDPSEFTKGQIKAVNQEKKNLKTELEIGQRLPRLLSGKVKIPKERTEKQKAATARLVLANKARAEQRRIIKNTESDINIQDSVNKAVKEILTKPKKELHRRCSEGEKPIPHSEKPIEPKKFSYFN